MTSELGGSHRGEGDREVVGQGGEDQHFSRKAGIGKGEKEHGGCRICQPLSVTADMVTQHSTGQSMSKRQGTGMTR